MILLRRYIFDFRFWLLLYFLVRLYAITDPPLDVGHNWRQSAGTMVSRNFHEVDNNILYPRVDHAGSKTGIVAMEFPLLNYTHYLMSEVFGYAHWYARLINLIVSTMGIWFFFRILRRHFGHRIAFFAGFLALNSLWFMYGRKIMPDTFAASLLVIGLWYTLKYLYDKGGWKSLVLSWSMVSLGLLTKLPAGILLMPLLAVPFDPRIDRKRLSVMIPLGLAALAPAIWWYFDWAPMLQDKYGFHFFLGQSISTSLAQISDAPLLVAKMFYEHALKFVGFAFFLIGLWMALRWKDRRMLVVFALGTVGVIIVLLKGGFTFYHHEYYILPFTLFMAIIAGYGIALIRNRIALWVVCLAVIGECVGNQHNQFGIHDELEPLMELEAQMDEISEQETLIAINSIDNPTPMYMAHRRGWLLTNHEMSLNRIQDHLWAEGCKYFVVLKDGLGKEVDLNLKIAEENEDWIIYELSAPSNRNLVLTSGT